MMSDSNNGHECKDELKVVVVMPAYNAEATLAETLKLIAPEFTSDIILVDDYSTDGTVALAKRLGLRVLVHDSNRGYGANQKTCYRAALNDGADIVVMVHPDNQYDSRLVPAMVSIIKLGVCDVVLGNRIRTRREALNGGMPKWKYFLNRSSTFLENLILGQGLGDFHSGFRAYSREVLESIPFELNSDDFSFDQEFLVQAVHFGFKIGDIPVPVRYFTESSSISFRRSLRYAFGGLSVLISYYLHKFRIRSDGRFKIHQ